MMRLRILLIFGLLVLIIGVPVIASDISDAEYYANITVSNNGTATTQVSVNMTLNTENLIDGLFVNSGANNTAIRNSSGSDTAFMPGVNSTSPWIFWVPSIGEDAQLTYILYTNATDGKLSYFPGETGMTTVDSASLELGDNFTIEQSAYVNTTYGDNKTLVYKEDAIEIYVGADDYFIATINDGIGDKLDYYDEAESGFNFCAAYGVNWFAQTFTTGYRYTITSVALRACRNAGGAPGTVTVSIRAASGGLPIGGDLTSGTTNGDTLPEYPTSEWRTVDLTDYDLDYDTQYAIVFRATSGDASNRALFAERPYNATEGPYDGGTECSSTDSGSTWGSDSDWDFQFRTYPYVSVLANIPSSDFVWRVAADTVNMTLSIDDVVQDSTSLGGASVPDNANILYFCAANTTPYMEYQKIWVDGIFQQHIEWSYNSTTFADMSGQGHDATPTFRSESSDPDVSATIGAFVPVAEAQAPAGTITDTTPWITQGANITANFTTGNTTPTFPLADVIIAVAEAGDVPNRLPFTILAGVTVIGSSFTFSWLLRRHGSGSIFAKVLFLICIIGIMVSVRWLDWWELVIFAILALAMAMMSRKVNW